MDLKQRLVKMGDDSLQFLDIVFGVVFGLKLFILCMIIYSINNNRVSQVLQLELFADNTNIYFLL